MPLDALSANASEMVPVGDRQQVAVAHAAR
jgi:hypothetical protein